MFAFNRLDFPFVTVRTSAIKLFIALLLLLPAIGAQAAILNVDCSKKSLQTEITSRLDRTAINTVNITGNCTGNVLLTSHVNLTLVGAPGATITGTADSPWALRVEGGTVNLQNLSVNAVATTTGVECTLRAVCVMRNVNVQAGALAGATGIAAQDQSAIDIIGSATISGQRAASGTGIGVYGASSINVRPTWAGGFDPLEAGPTISGHDIGLTALDGTFLRTDNALIEDNASGVFAQRDATIKILGGSAGGVLNNDNEGIFINRGSSAQVGTPVSGNGLGLWVGALSVAHVQVGGGISGNLEANVTCAHATAVVQGSSACP